MKLPWGLAKNKKGFSDEEIDAFVEMLKANKMTLEGEINVKEAIHAHTNDDPRRIREKKISPALLLDKSTFTYKVWHNWSEKPDELEFEPFEFMGEHIEEAHQVWLKNKRAHNEDIVNRQEDGNIISDVDRLDDNEKEILEFKLEIEQFAASLDNVRISCGDMEESELSELNDTLKEEKTDDISSSVPQDDEALQLKALGGFGSFEDAIKELEQVGVVFDEDSSFNIEDVEIPSSFDEPVDEVLKENADEKPENALSEDAIVRMYMSGNKIRLWMFIFPPAREGKDVTEELIRKMLEERGVTYGIDNFMIHKTVTDKLYFKFIEIATGIDPLDGKDGSVKELISREKRVEIKEDENGRVNYRNLNIIKSVVKGETICEITLPTKGTDGHTVINEIAKSKDGKYPNVPQGQNTELNEDRTKLIAKMDGEVEFVNGKFKVQKILNIDGDIDNSVGNIDFHGDLVVHGDIREGFTIKVDGDLYVNGTAESCTLIVGGNITIGQSVLGGKKTFIRCGGIFKANHVENCTIISKGNVICGNMIWSEISTDDSVILNPGKGAIVGGKIIAGKSVKAETIGSRMNSSIVTKIVIGIVPSNIEAKEKLSKALVEVKNNIQKMQQNIKYIENSNSSSGNDRQKLLQQLKLQLQMRSLQKIQMEKRISKLDIDFLSGLSSAKMYCDNIFPLVYVTIGAKTVQIKNEGRNCRMTYVNKDIRVEITSEDAQNL